MKLSRKIILGIILTIQTILIAIMAISLQKNKKCNEELSAFECLTEYKYHCSKGKQKKEDFDQEYYEEYIVDKEGLIIYRTLTEKYLFDNKDKYEFQKDNFKPMEDYQINKDDKKMEIIISKKEYMVSLELWYRLLEKNLEERGFTCEEIIN